ncbi:MAG: hypothetical protein JW839_11800 [Candidatus Lokiarchaeota archaeon]|nr:hypothetical protein [Candidatus Lokiarchaeota archaeon]
MSKAAQYQIDNSIKGVLTYHFSRPSAEEPEKLRFIEFYTSEKAFWEHGMDPAVGKELMSTFDPNIRKSFSWWAFYPNNTEKSVKETAATLGAIEILPVQNHVNLNYRSRFVVEPVLFVGKLPKNQIILRSFFEQNREPFCESALYHFVFTDSLGELHVISLWSSQDDIIDSLIRIDLPGLELQPHIYLGKGTPTKRLRKIFEPWNPKFLTKPEAGYCLHPKYSSIS